MISQYKPAPRKRKWFVCFVVLNIFLKPTFVTNPKIQRLKSVIKKSDGGKKCLHRCAAGAHVVLIFLGSTHCSGQMVQAQLHDVQQIQSAEHAFAAIRSDGRVVTWGNGTLTVRKETAPKSLKKMVKKSSWKGVPLNHFVQFWSLFQINFDR